MGYSPIKLLYTRIAMLKYKFCKGRFVSYWLMHIFYIQRSISIICLIREWVQAQLRLKYNHYCIGKREGPCMTSILRGDIHNKSFRHSPKKTSVSVFRTVTKLWWWDDVRGLQPQYILGLFSTGALLNSLTTTGLACKLANIYFEPPTKILTVDFYKYMIWLILNR